MKKVKLRKIGNSIGIIIPREVLENKNLTLEDEMYISEEVDGILITKKPFYSTITPQAIKLAEEIIQDYKTDFEDLVGK